MRGTTLTPPIPLALAVALLASVAVAATGMAATPVAQAAPESPASKPIGEAAPTIPWVMDYARARQQAAAEGKDLLINFTGSDWCGFCHRLEAEVFSHAAFLDIATTQFVFVFLDFPKGEKARRAVVDPERNDRMRREMGVQGFPTIVLATAGGAPYARTGYREGGPDGYLAHLAELRTSGAKVKALLANQDDTRTIEHLQAAIPVLAEQGFLHNAVFAAQRKLVYEKDPDGQLGLRALVLAAEEFDTFLSYLNSLGEQMPDWNKLHGILLACEHISGNEMFLRVATTTAQWLREEAGKPAEAKALFQRLRKDPMVEGNPQVMQMLQAEIDLCDEAASRPKAPEGGKPPAPEAEETPRSKSAGE